MDPEYRRRRLFAVHLDRELSIVQRAGHLAGDAACLPVARTAVDVVSECNAFRTLQDHAVRIASARSLPPAAVGDIRAALEELSKRGLLVSKNALLERAHDASAAPSHGRIDSVCMTTRNRPEAVQRAIRSYATHMRAFGRAPSWTVLDSSPDPAARARTREGLEPLAREGIALSYASVAEKEAYGAALAAEAGVDPEIVRFALFDVEAMGHDTGANRNALLLAHAGQMLLSVDDDAVCDVRGANGGVSDARARAIELTAFHNPEVRLFESADDARASLPSANVSLLDAHEALLGRSVDACLRGLEASGVIAETLSDDALEAILEGRANVSATMGGFWGDCAATSPAYYLFCEGPPPSDFPRDPTSYRKLVSSRQIVRMAQRPTISAGATLMAVNLGMDLRTLSAPFFPTRRAQDLIFGTILRRCFEGRFFGFVPYAIGHLPVEQRTHASDPKALWGTGKPKLAAFVFHAIQLASLDHSSPGAPRMRMLGRHLTELGTLPWPDFERLLARRVWQASANELRLLRKRLSAADASSPWAHDAQAYADVLLHSIGNSDIALPESLRATRSVDDARALMQRLFRRFGGLLEAWPAIFSAAQSLNERGVTLAHRLSS